MAKIKTEAKPKKGMTLHKYIATGGDPKSFNSMNGTEALRASSKKRNG